MPKDDKAKTGAASEGSEKDATTGSDGGSTDAQATATGNEPVAEAQGGSEGAPENKSTSKSRVIKFMGVSDVRRLLKGDTAGGTLPPLPVTVEFSRSNHWKVDSKDYPTVPAEWWAHLADNEAGFEDVTDAKVVPLNVHQRTFLGMQQKGETKRTAAPEPGAAPVSSAG